MKLQNKYKDFDIKQVHKFICNTSYSNLIVSDFRKCLPKTHI